MLSYTDLKKGTFFVLNNEPYEVLDSNFMRMQQRKGVMQTKIRNVISGKVVERNVQASESFEEADIQKKSVLFIYAHRSELWFHEVGNPKERFSLQEDYIGEQARFFKPNTSVTALVFRDRIIGIKLPIKMDFEVVEAPPGIKGSTAQAGSKQVKLETGTTVLAPMFINSGDIIRINTETGEYVERAEKG